MIERFSKQEFEDTLPTHQVTGVALWSNMGMINGEWCYAIDVNSYARIVIRSSVDSSEIAADAGEDSIRLHAEIKTKGGGWKAIKKLDSWTTRVPGWDERMKEKMRKLWSTVSKVQRTIPSCPSCGKMQPFWITKNGKNTGRPASKCINCDKGFTWMDESGGEKPLESEPSPVTQDDTQEGGQDEEKGEDTDSIFAEIAKIAEEEFEREDRKEDKEEITPNAQQLLAIEAPIDGAHRVLSGPGGGKTFTITRRYRFLTENGVDPEKIMVVTFSKAQSQDMLEKIVRHNPYIIGTIAEKWICTNHAFCARSLHIEGFGREVPKNWRVKQMLNDIIPTLWDVVVKETGELKERPAWDELLSAFSNAKAYCIPAGEDESFYTSAFGEFHGPKLAEARATFDARMHSQGYWLFMDMLFDMEYKLTNDLDFRARVQAKHEFVMLDEGQDTNGQTMRILAMVAQPQNQVFFVGDPDQLLFRFTGATPEANLYNGFDDRYVDAYTFMLETNYRSSQTLVERANTLIRKNYQMMGGPYEDDFLKTLRAREDAPEGVDVIFTEYDNPEMEGAGVSDEIQILLEGGLSPGEIFVLARTRAQLGYLEGPLTRLGVPFVNITGGSFWLLSHVQDVLSYMRLARDNESSDAFQRIYNISSRYMTDRDGEYCTTRWLGKAFLRAVDGKYNKFDLQNAAKKRYSWRKGIEDLIDMVDEVEHALQDGLGAAVRAVMDMGYEKWLRYEYGMANDDPSMGKLSDIETVIDIANRFDEVDEFFDRVDQAIQAAEDAKNKNWGDYVVLSTVHRIKGMERDIVFGLGWSEGEIEVDDGRSVPYGLLPHTYALADPPQRGVLNFGGRSSIEDERCIAFVALTRARDRVYISSLRTYRNATMWPSRFVEELKIAVR